MPLCPLHTPTFLPFPSHHVRGGGRRRGPSRPLPVLVHAPPVGHPFSMGIDPHWDLRSWFRPPPLSGDGAPNMALSCFMSSDGIDHPVLMVIFFVSVSYMFCLSLPLLLCPLFSHPPLSRLALPSRHLHRAHHQPARLDHLHTVLWLHCR